MTDQMESRTQADTLFVGSYYIAACDGMEWKGLMGLTQGMKFGVESEA